MNRRSSRWFLSTETPPVAYEVLALSQPFEDLVGPHLPVLTQTVLPPFKDRIVYAGLRSSDNVTFGPDIRRNLDEGFKTAKDLQGLSRYCRSRPRRQP